MEVLKTRLRVVLLTLLRTGCDPNVLDYQNASPTTYARQYDLWPQWSWALEQAGYEYDMRQDRWVRRFAFCWDECQPLALCCLLL